MLALCVGGAAVYVGDYYPADDTTREALATTERVAVQRTADGLVFLPDEAVSGFFFYPGGLVDHTAYAPLMRALAEEGVLCVLVDMPLRLAVLDTNAADGAAAIPPQEQIDQTVQAILPVLLGGAQ